MARLRYSADAEADLEAISEFTAREYGLDQAVRYRKLFEAAFRHVADYPSAAPAATRAGRPDVRRHLTGRHAIYYRIDDGGASVFILRVLHQAQDPLERL